MAVPSNPGWTFGYVPSPGEWNNTFAGKVDYPAPVAQGGTGGQTEFDGNYNLQQRAEVITTTQAAAALTLYSVRTDLTATSIRLPVATTCKAGDWIDIFDAGANASANTITILAADGDAVMVNGTSTTSLLLVNNGARCILVTDGVATWRAQVTTQSTGIGIAVGRVRTITESTTVEATYAGCLCKVSGAATVITLPTTGFVEGSTIAFDNVDPTNAVTFAPGAGDYPTSLNAGACCIVVADSAGAWWQAANSGTTNTTPTAIAPRQIVDAAYTLKLTDAGQYLQFTSDAPVAVTVPAYSETAAFALGSVCVLEQYGLGKITLVADTGVTLNGRNGKSSAGQFAVMQVKSGSNGSADIWTILGDAAA